MNSYRQMIAELQKTPTYSAQQALFQGINLQNEKYYHEDQRGHLHELPLYDQKNRRINYYRKRNFLIKASNLPKQFGFEVQV